MINTTNIKIAKKYEHMISHIESEGYGKEKVYVVTLKEGYMFLNMECGTLIAPTVAEVLYYVRNEIVEDDLSINTTETNSNNKDESEKTLSEIIEMKKETIKVMKSNKFTALANAKEIKIMEEHIKELESQLPKEPIKDRIKENDLIAFIEFVHGEAFVNFAIKKKSCSAFGYNLKGKTIPYKFLSSKNKRLDKFAMTHRGSKVWDYGHYCFSGCENKLTTSEMANLVRPFVNHVFILKDGAIISDEILRYRDI